MIFSVGTTIRPKEPLESLDLDPALQGVADGILAPLWTFRTYQTRAGGGSSSSSRAPATGALAGRGVGGLGSARPRGPAPPVSSSGAGAGSRRASAAVGRQLLDLEQARWPDRTPQAASAGPHGAHPEVALGVGGVVGRLTHSGGHAVRKREKWGETRRRNDHRTPVSGFSRPESRTRRRRKTSGRRSPGAGRPEPVHPEQVDRHQQDGGQDHRWSPGRGRPGWSTRPCSSRLRWRSGTRRTADTGSAGR